MWLVWLFSNNESLKKAAAGFYDMREAGAFKGWLKLWRASSKQAKINKELRRKSPSRT